MPICYMLQANQVLFFVVFLTNGKRAWWMAAWVWKDLPIPIFILIYYNPYSQLAFVLYNVGKDWWGGEKTHLIFLYICIWILYCIQLTYTTERLFHINTIKKQCISGVIYLLVSNFLLLLLLLMLACRI